MSENVVILSHDPFARVEHVRICRDSYKPCTWCGNTRSSGKMFYYGTWQEGINTRPDIDNKPFCSKDCYNNYFL